MRLGSYTILSMVPKLVRWFRVVPQDPSSAVAEVLKPKAEECSLDPAEAPGMRPCP